jgi:hypothetical protein
MSHLRIFGSAAYLYIQQQYRNKLEPKARRSILVAYDNNTKGSSALITRQRKSSSLRTCCATNKNLAFRCRRNWDLQKTVSSIISSTKIQASKNYQKIFITLIPHYLYLRLIPTLRSSSQLLDQILQFKGPCCPMSNSEVPSPLITPNQFHYRILVHRLYSKSKKDLENRISN